MKARLCGSLPVIFKLVKTTQSDFDKLVMALSLLKSVSQNSEDSIWIIFCHTFNLIFHEFMHRCKCHVSWKIGNCKVSSEHDFQNNSAKSLCGEVSIQYIICEYCLGVCIHSRYCIDILALLFKLSKLRCKLSVESYVLYLIIRPWSSSDSMRPNKWHEVYSKQFDIPR